MPDGSRRTLRKPDACRLLQENFVLGEMPFALMNKIRRVPDFSEIHTRYDDTQRTIAMNSNYEAIVGFLSNRVLPITRENAKKYMHCLGLNRHKEKKTKRK